MKREDMVCECGNMQCLPGSCLTKADYERTPKTNTHELTELQLHIFTPEE